MTFSTHSGIKPLQLCSYLDTPNWSVSVKRDLKDHVDDESDQEDWLHPFDRLGAKLDHSRASIHNAWSKMQPKKVLSRTIKSLKQLPKKVRMYSILHTIRSGKLDVRRTDEPGALFSNDFLRFVLRRHHRTMRGNPDDAMIHFLRMYLPEVEVAILISRAKLFEGNALHIENELFRQWATYKVSAKKLREAFMEDSSWQVGDEVYGRGITDAYRKNRVLLNTPHFLLNTPHTPHPFYTTM
uniref:RxLR effector candidate protein n=1 Tax=Hyaloperonospora arabidopsidis (strain Emoy2) TaxID=559515 RepID=M4BPX7_HYAAE